MNRIKVTLSIVAAGALSVMAAEDCNTSHSCSHTKPSPDTQDCATGLGSSCAGIGQNNCASSKSWEVNSGWPKSSVPNSSSVIQCGYDGYNPIMKDIWSEHTSIEEKNRDCKRPTDCKWFPARPDVFGDVAHCGTDPQGVGQWVGALKKESKNCN